MRYILALCILCLSVLVQAQNLVPNPGFEYINTCTGTDFFNSFYPTSQPIRVKNWFSPSKGTPDYFSECDSSVPYNGLGYHPANNGIAYAGYIAYNGTRTEPWQYTEYLSVELYSPLQADSFYDVSCYVKLGTKRLSQALVASFNSMSVSLSEEQVLSEVRPVIPHINLYADDGRYIDTTEWVKISRIYKAKGNEKWLILGSFLSETPPPFKSLFDVDTTGNKSYYAYYIVDDVSVSKRDGCKIFSSRHDTFCHTPGASSTLSSTAEGNSSYLWNTGDTSRSITITNDGAYNCLAIRDCDTYIDSFFVKTGIDTMHKAIPQNIVICEGDEEIMTPGVKGRLYAWDNGSYEEKRVVSQPGVYSCYITIDNCHIEFEQFKVSLSTNITDIADHLNDTTICKNMPLGKEQNLNVSYLWNTGDTLCCIFAQTHGKYAVTITTEKCGSIADSADIRVANCESCLFFPSAFTPNGDGLNDQFRSITSCPINNFTFRIFNRWGQEVFTTQDVHKGWDGMHGADIADVGTYFYLVEYNTAWSAEMKTTKGDILLIR